MTFVPDVRQLAELFDSWDYDFRIILLERNPESVLHSVLVKRKFDYEILPQCKMYAFAMKAMMFQLKALDPRFIAGAVSIERTREENVQSFDKHLQPFLNFNRGEIDMFFRKFRQSLPSNCVESPRENQTEILKCRSDLYSEFYPYRRLFNKYFDASSSF